MPLLFLGSAHVLPGRHRWPKESQQPADGTGMSIRSCSCGVAEAFSRSEREHGFAGRNKDFCCCEKGHRPESIVASSARGREGLRVSLQSKAKTSLASSDPAHPSKSRSHAHTTGAFPPCLTFGVTKKPGENLGFKSTRSLPAKGLAAQCYMHKAVANKRLMPSIQRLRRYFLIILFVMRSISLPAKELQRVCNFLVCLFH